MVRSSGYRAHSEVPQFAVSQFSRAHAEYHLPFRLLRETLAIPPITAVASLGTILLRISVSWVCNLLQPRTAEEPTEQGRNDATSSGFREKLKRHINSHGGPLAFWYQVTRMFGGVALLTLTIITARRGGSTAPEDILVEQDAPLAQSWGWGSAPPSGMQPFDLAFGAVYVSPSLDHRNSV